MSKSNFIGFLVPEDLDDCLRIQAIVHGEGKGSIIRKIIEEHASANKWSVDMLATEFADILYKRWYLHWKENMNWPAYIKRAETQLKDKNQPKHLIDTIIKKCREKKSL
jgi:hypothetical protein